MIINGIKKTYYYARNYSFETLFVLSIAVILFLAIFRIGKKGSYTKESFGDMLFRFFGPKINKKAYRPNRDSLGKESKGETECRRVMEMIFKVPFRKKRPDFLRNDVTGGNNLELDCYSEELKLAVEYNGAQHYKFIPFFHKNNEAFLNQKYRDELKRRMCKDNGIKLIEVPYTVNIDKIQDYLINKLMK